MLFRQWQSTVEVTMGDTSHGCKLLEWRTLLLGGLSWVGRGGERNDRELFQQPLLLRA